MPSMTADGSRPHDEREVSGYLGGWRDGLPDDYVRESGLKEPTGRYHRARRWSARTWTWTFMR